MLNLINALCKSGYDFDMAITIAEQFESDHPLVLVREEPRKEDSDVERVQS